jgi:glycosyltransferase involved in cell wall biosynthesis
MAIEMAPGLWMDGRIALFTRDLAAGGVARVIANLSRGFIGRGHPVDVVLARARGPFIEQLAAEVRVIDLGVERSLASIPGLVRYLRRERPLALLACQDGANVVALWSRWLARGSTRVLISIHTNVSQNARAATKARGRLIPHFIRWFYGWADDVIAVSEGVADDLAGVARLDRERIHVIYNPVDTENIKALATEPLRHPWFGSGAPPVVVSAGRLTRQKDFPSLLHAFARVRQSRSARLMILGEGEDRASLEGLARQLDCRDDIALPGFMPNPYPYMAAAGVFVLSSAWEGFGNVLIEAMALGVPVVSTDCPSGPAEILGRGRYGTLVPVSDVDALARAIATTLDHPPEAGRSIERARSFSCERIASQYLAAIAH